MKKSLDKFGKLVIENMRDKQIDFVNSLFENKWKSEELVELQNKLSEFDAKEQLIIKQMVEILLTNTMHDFLFALQDSHDSEEKLDIIVDQKELICLSDGLHGEIFGDEGWIVRFSKFKSEIEIISCFQ